MFFHVYKALIRKYLYMHFTDIFSCLKAEPLPNMPIHYKSVVISVNAILVIMITSCQLTFHDMINRFRNQG